MLLRSFRKWFAPAKPCRAKRGTARPLLEALEDRFSTAVQTITIADSSAQEGDGTANSPSGVVQFVVTRSGDVADTSQPLDLDYRTLDGTAVAGKDYVGVATGPVHFGPGALTTTVNVKLIGNTIWQPGPNRSFTVQLFNPISISANPNVVIPTSNPNNASPTNGLQPKAVAYADFNQDGKQDIVTANYQSNDVSILMNNTPTGSSNLTYITYNVPAPVPVTANRFDLAVGNLFGNVGEQDIVLADFANDSITVLANTIPKGLPATLDPSSHFTSTTYSLNKGDQPFAVVIADFNGDGKMDIAFTDHGTNNVGVLLQKLIGNTFGAEVLLNSVPITQAAGLAVGDLNGDGKPDLVAGSWNLGGGGVPTNVAVLLNTFPAGGAAATFTPTFLAAGENPISVALVDVNQSGTLDIAVANAGKANTAPVYPNDDTVSIWMNLTSPGGAVFVPGTRWNIPTFVDQAYDPTTGANPFNPTGAFNSYPRAITVQDVNGDGAADLTIALRDNAGQPQARTSILLNETPKNASTPDFFLQNLLAPSNFPRDVTWGTPIPGSTKLGLAVAGFGSATVPLNNVSVFLDSTQQVLFQNFTATGSIIDDDIPTGIAVFGAGSFTAVVNTNFSPSPQVLVTNVHNDGVFGTNVTFVAPIQDVSGNFGGLLQRIISTDAKGIAVPDTLTASKTAGKWTLFAVVNGVTLPLRSFAMTNTPGVPAQIAFLTQPTDRLPSQVFDNPPGIQVAIEDAFGNPITTGPNSLLPITMHLKDSTGAKVDPNLDSTSTTFTIKASAGMATFPDLSVNTSGSNFNLDAEAKYSSLIISGLSDPFNVRGPAASIHFRLPKTLNIHQSYRFTLTLLDAFGNLAAPLTGPLNIKFLTHGSFSVKQIGSSQGGSVRTYILVSHTVGKARMRISTVVDGFTVSTDSTFYTVYGAKYHVS